MTSHVWFVLPWRLGLVQRLPTPVSWPLFHLVFLCPSWPQFLPVKQNSRHMNDIPQNSLFLQSKHTRQTHTYRTCVWHDPQCPIRFTGVELLLKNTNRTDVSIASLENLSKRFAIIGWKLFGKTFEKVRANWLKPVSLPFQGIMGQASMTSRIPRGLKTKRCRPTHSRSLQHKWPPLKNVKKKTFSVFSLSDRKTMRCLRDRDTLPSWQINWVNDTQLSTSQRQRRVILLKCVPKQKISIGYFSKGKNNNRLIRNTRGRLVKFTQKIKKNEIQAPTTPPAAEL